VFRPLHIRDRSVAEAISLLSSSVRGTPLLTVNYDTLLSSTIGDRTPVSHVELVKEGKAEHFAEPGLLGDDLRDLYVVHLHGMFTDVSTDRGFSLASDEYLTRDSVGYFVRFLLPLLRSGRQLIFVGASGTLTDPHFESLWFALRCTAQLNATHQRTDTTPPEHFVLLPNVHDEASRMQKELDGVMARSGVRLTILGYPHYEDLKRAILGLYYPPWLLRSPSPPS
jgi:hypothetical protein